MTTEATAIDARTATALIAAAAGSVNPAEHLNAGAWERQVAERAEVLLRLVPALVDRSAVLAECQPVTGVVVKVEEVKGRGLIITEATMGTLQRNQEVAASGRGIEHFRTGWLNDGGRALFDAAGALLGRHVRIGKRIESGTDANGEPLKVRMAEWIEDLGPDPLTRNGNGASNAAPNTNGTNGQRRQGTVTPPRNPAPVPQAQPATDGPDPDPGDWFVGNGWGRAGQATHDAARAKLVAARDAAPPAVVDLLMTWTTATKGLDWKLAWTGNEYALVRAKLDELIREHEAALVAVGGGADGEPEYPYGAEPF